MAIVIGLVAAGWSDDQIFRELSDPRRCQAALILKEKHGGSLLGQIRSKIGIARSEVQKHRIEIDGWFKQFLHLCPRKRSASLVRTATALAYIARESGSRTFTASIRQVAEIAGLGTATHKGADTKTVRNSLSKLSELGFISRRIRTSVDEDEPQVMTEITLEVLDELEYPTIPIGTPWNSGADKYPSYILGKFSYKELLHPLWEHSGLGLNAFRVWILLRSRGDLTISEIANALVMAPQQVGQILHNRLEEYGLATPLADGRWRAIGRDLDEAAESVGVSDRPDLRTRAFEIQRQNRNKALRQRASERQRKQFEMMEKVDFATGEIIEESNRLATDNPTPTVGGSIDQD